MTTKPKQSRIEPKKKVSAKSKIGQPKKTASTAYQKKRFIEAMADNFCYVLRSEKATGIPRQRHYEWMQRDPEYASQIEDLTTIRIEFAEESLFEHMKTNPVPAMFFLKCKAGYREKHEIELSGGLQIGSLADALKDD